MRFVTLTVFILLLLSSPVKADEKVANIISYVTVGANLTLDTINSIRATDKSNAFKKQALRTSLTIGLSEVFKRIIHETRPDGSDEYSFPSEHTALSCVSVNVTHAKKFAVEFPIALGTAIGRVQANKHFWWDVLTGCGIGLATGLIR